MPRLISATHPSPSPKSFSRPRTPRVSSAEPPVIKHEHMINGSIESRSIHTPTPNRSFTKSTLPPTFLHDADPQDSELLPLQMQNNLEETEDFNPVTADDPGSFDLVAAPEGDREDFSLEKRSQLLFSRDHLQVIFADPIFLFEFTAFLSAHRPQSVPILVYFLDALKATRAIHYSNAICQGLDPIDGLEFTSRPVKPSINLTLEQWVNNAFDMLVKEELPAYVTHKYISIVSLSIQRRITGTLARHLQAASEGLAEVFCLTDPSRPDNPIVFASEEFNCTTQYGMSYILGRNCRFLQGPWTNPLSVRRLRDSIVHGRHHQEVFLNYRRDGSPFMNLLMCAPLRDSRGRIRYFIGAQVDVSGLVKDCTELESLQRLVELYERGEEPPQIHKPSAAKNDELRELSEMLNTGEINTVRRYGGRMHREMTSDDADSISMGSSQPRLLINEPDMMKLSTNAASVSGKLGGIYQNYLLVRPYPALRILFASPSQRLPGILQSPFLNKIGGSDRVREELRAALADGRGVTAKVQWVAKGDDEGRSRWIHCTPLLGGNGQIGVWMVVIVDDGQDAGFRRRRQAPPVPPSPARSQPPARDGAGRLRSRTEGDEGPFPRRTTSQNEENGIANGVNGVNGVNGMCETNGHVSGESSGGGSVRSGSPNSLLIY